MVDDMKAILAQHNELKDYADDVRIVRRNMQFYKEQMNCAWRGSEIRSMNYAVEDLDARLLHISAELEELSHDFLLEYTQQEENQIGGETDVTDTN